MSIVLIIVRVLLLFAVLNFAVKARTGSFLDNSDLVAWQKRPGYVWLRAHGLISAGVTHVG
jgi:hypothetical protein